MDRSAFAAYAAMLLPLCAALGTGCDTAGTCDSSQSTMPEVLADLQRSSPGPWRRLPDAPLLTANLTQATDSMIDSPAAGTLDPEVQADADETTVTVSTGDDEATAGAGETEDTPAVRVEPLAPLPAEFDGAAEAVEADRLPPVPSPAGEVLRASEAGMAVLAAPRVAFSESESILQGSAADQERSMLPWASSAPRTSEMSAAARRADERVRRGSELADRGALYSARSEYIAALQIIAQANDTQQSTQFFSKSLAVGLAALKESRDFVHQSPRKPEVDVASTVRRHKTPILKGDDLHDLPPLAAAQRYHTFAQEQLAAASAHEATGSMALYGLGKASIAPIGKVVGAQTLVRTAQAMVLYKAALLADPKNFRAANELGVLLAENGSLPRARELLIQSVSLAPQAATWHNLAVVHARLGEHELGQRARAQSAALANSEPAVAGPAVQWVDSTTFARAGAVSEGLSLPSSPSRPASVALDAAANQQKSATPPSKKGGTAWLPWTPRR